MSVISKHYCNDCHHAPVLNDAKRGEKVKTKFKGLCSRFVSHAYVSGKTFTGHPITSALLTTALIATAIAGSVLMGTGLIVPGFVLLTVAYTVTVLGAALFIIGRRDVDTSEHKEAHSFDKMQKFIQKDQKVCLVLEATHDYNGAFKTKGPKKWERKYPVIHIKVSNIKEVNDAIEKVASVAKIQVLWLAGHGNWNSIRLGDNSCDVLTADNVFLLTDAFSKLEPNATIIGNSCKTAKISKDHPNEPNMACRTSEAAPGRNVIMPTVSICHDNLFLKGGKKPKIRMEMHKLGLKGTYLDKLTPNFIGKHFRNNVMRVYKDGVLQDAVPSFKIDPQD